MSRFLGRPQLSRSGYRPEIDGLRALAVVAVIINHFNKELLPSGYLGVDIFCDFRLRDHVFASRKTVWKFLGFHDGIL